MSVPQAPGRHLARRQQGEHGIGRGRGEVGGERLDVGERLLVVAPHLGADDDHQPRAAEQPERIAGTRRVLAAHALAVIVLAAGRELLDDPSSARTRARRRRIASSTFGRSLPPIR